MAQFGAYSLAQLSDLRDELQSLASPCATLREAAEVCLGRIYDEFSESLVLARCYTTLPFSFMPDREKESATRVATGRSLVEQLGKDTIVAVLAAARGKRPDWSDPANSFHKLAVPLLTPECLEPIPIVGRVLSATMSSLPWLKRQETLMMTDTTGGMSRLILVEDARTTQSSDGSKAVVDQAFVVDNGVRSVMAMGGSYLNGSALVLVLYTTESLSHEQATKFPTIVNTMKTATMKAVMSTKLL